MGTTGRCARDGNIPPLRPTRSQPSGSFQLPQRVMVKDIGFEPQFTVVWDVVVTVPA